MGKKIKDNRARNIFRKSYGIECFVKRDFWTMKRYGSICLSFNNFRFERRVKLDTPKPRFFPSEALEIFLSLKSLSDADTTYLVRAKEQHNMKGLDCVWFNSTSLNLLEALEGAGWHFSKTYNK